MHVAIIMDGNGRWATERGLPRSAGHRAGAKAVNLIVEAAARAKVATLTLYAFSSANWGRPEPEVRALFALLRRYLQQQTLRCLEQSIRLEIIGRRDRLSAPLIAAIENSERVTAQGKGMRLRIAVDYSAQQSILDTCRRLATLGDIDRAQFIQTLGPEVDLLIRTGGEQRLSDFLLWECAYAELHFEKKFWPDFDAPAFAQALDDYSSRQRRFGLVTPAAGLARAAS
jgi:undecaprenyl diphosphate synthase